MKSCRLVLLIAVVAHLGGCAATRPTVAVLSLQPFVDTYRWHQYHLSRESPKSPDGVFQLIRVSKDGSAELLCLEDDFRLVVKKNPSLEELVANRMPMRVTQFDYEQQSVDFEWLTTN